MSSIIRPIDESIRRRNDSIYLQVARVPAEFDRPDDLLELVTFSDSAIQRPRDEDPPRRRRDYPVRRPGDNPPAIRKPDNLPIERQQ